MEQYIGEIRIFGGNYAPSGWALCNGQLLNIVEHEILFSLIGTTYGGDGQTTFALPDLRGRLALHMGPNPTTGTQYNLGQKGGTETVTLTSNQLPAHTHAVSAQSAAGTTNSPTNAFWATSGAMQYSTQAPNGTMNPQAVSIVGGDQYHENMMPYLPMNYIISLEGLWPQQN